MAYGLSIMKPNGKLQIDSETGQDAYQATVVGTAQNDVNKLITRDIQSASYPLLAVRNGAGKIHSVKQDSKGKYTQVTIAVLPDFVDGIKNADYAILTTGYFPTTEKGYGIAIYDKTGKLKYSSKYHFMKIKEAISADDYFKMVWAIETRGRISKRYDDNPTKINTAYGELTSENSSGTRRLRSDLMTLKQKAKTGGLWLITNSHFGSFGLGDARTDSCYGVIVHYSAGGRTTVRGSPLVGINDKTIIFLQHFEMMSFSGRKPSKPYHTNGNALEFSSYGNLLLVDL